jgi:hypothetical protein
VCSFIGGGLAFGLTSSGKTIRISKAFRPQPFLPSFSVPQVSGDPPGEGAEEQAGAEDADVSVQAEGIGQADEETDESSGEHRVDANRGASSEECDGETAAEGLQNFSGAPGMCAEDGHEDVGNARSTPQRIAMAIRFKRTRMAPYG